MIICAALIDNLPIFSPAIAWIVDRSYSTDWLGNRECLVWVGVRLKVRAKVSVLMLPSRFVSGKGFVSVLIVL